MPIELELTRRQMEILEVIRRGVSERGFPPSIREIGERVGLSSSSTVHCHLRNLEEKGFIKRDPARPRCIEILSDPLEVAARAPEPEPDPDWPAGVGYFPLLEDLASVAPGYQPMRIPLPRDLAGGDDAFLFQVEGDSMRDAAILHGDLVVARRRVEAEDGDIVVALVNQEITVKRYFRGNGHVRLEPDNRRMKPIFVRDAQILGKVVAVIRRVY
ncbi:MAG: transcriptional repressor LexA [Armatimonadetes bacterium]|nr:transcriptional repressor LexA [Armatimonadota bacterium]